MTGVFKRSFVLLALGLITLVGTAPAPRAEQPPASLLPDVRDLGYFLSKLSEREKSDALNTLADLAADPHLDSAKVEGVFTALMSGNPPPEYGYGCENCFQKRLSRLLVPLRLAGPAATPPREAVIVMPLDDRVFKKLRKDTADELGGSLPALVKKLLEGYELAGRFTPSVYARYHGRGADVRHEPAFITSGQALAGLEAEKGDLDAWSLSRWMCIDGPRGRFAPGFLVLYLDPSQTCTEVHVPTAADSEDPNFRAAPQSNDSGFSCGGAPQWVCPNFPLSAATRVRYVPNSGYIQGM